MSLPLPTANEANPGRKKTRLRSTQYENETQPWVARPSQIRSSSRLLGLVLVARTSAWDSRARFMEAEVCEASVDEKETVEESLAACEHLLRRVALALCDSSAEADDLVQDTFEKALRNAKQFDGKNPRGWLITVMRNLFFDRCRREARRPRSIPLKDRAAIDTPSPAPAWHHLDMDDLRRAVDQLSPKLAEVYRLRAFSELRYANIATQLNIPIDTVSSRLSRARKELRRLLTSNQTISGKEKP